MLFLMEQLQKLNKMIQNSILSKKKKKTMALRF